MVVPSEEIAASNATAKHQERRLATKDSLYPYMILSLVVVGSFFASLAVTYHRVAFSKNFSEYGVPFIPEAPAKPAESAKHT